MSSLIILYIQEKFSLMYQINNQPSASAALKKKIIEKIKLLFATEVVKNVVAVPILTSFISSRSIFSVFYVRL